MSFDEEYYTHLEEYYNDMQTQLHADIPEIRFYLDEEYNEIALISTDGGLYISDDY